MFKRKKKHLKNVLQLLYFFFEIFTFQTSLVWECLHTNKWHPKTVTSVRTSTLFNNSYSRKLTMPLIMDENSSLTRGVQSLVLNINESLQVKEWSAAAVREISLICDLVHLIALLPDGPCVLFFYRHYSINRRVCTRNYWALSRYAVPLEIPPADTRALLPCLSFYLKQQVSITDGPRSTIFADQTK